jgi:hypothetical protein
MAPTNPLRHESTAVMASNIGRELKELRAALANSRGDLVADPASPLRPWPTCSYAAASSCRTC